MNSIKALIKHADIMEIKYGSVKGMLDNLSRTVRDGADLASLHGDKLSPEKFDILKRQITHGLHLVEKAVWDTVNQDRDDAAFQARKGASALAAKYAVFQHDPKDMCCGGTMVRSQCPYHKDEQKPEHKQRIKGTYWEERFHFKDEPKVNEHVSIEFLNGGKTYHGKILRKWDKTYQDPLRVSHWISIFFEDSNEANPMILTYDLKDPRLDPGFARRQQQYLKP